LHLESIDEIVRTVVFAWDFYKNLLELLHINYSIEYCIRSQPIAKYE